MVSSIVHTCMFVAGVIFAKYQFFSIEALEAKRKFS